MKIQDFRTEKKSHSYHGRQTKAHTRGKNQIGHTVLFRNIQCQKAWSRYLQRPQGKSEKRFNSLIFFFFLRYINYTYVGSSFISFLLSCIRLFIFHCVERLLIWHIPSCLTHCVPVSSWSQHCWRAAQEEGGEDVRDEPSSASILLCCLAHPLIKVSPFLENNIFLLLSPLEGLWGLGGAPNPQPFVLGSAAPSPYLIPFPFPLQQTPWAEGHLEHLDKKKCVSRIFSFNSGSLAIFDVK